MDNFMPVKYIDNCRVTKKGKKYVLHGAAVPPVIEKKLGQRMGHDLYQQAKVEGKNITRYPAIYTEKDIIATALALTDREK